LTSQTSGTAAALTANVRDTPSWAGIPKPVAEALLTPMGRPTTSRATLSCMRSGRRLRHPLRLCHRLRLRLSPSRKSRRSRRTRLPLRCQLNRLRRGRRWIRSGIRRTAVSRLRACPLGRACCW
jgi:hypothetical protein